MPRRRATKLTSRAKPKLPTGDEGSGMTQDERKAKLEVIIRDFDMEVETRLAKMEREAKDMCKAIHRAVTMEIFKMPPNVKKMTMKEFFASGGAFNEKALQDFTEQVDTLASSICSKSSTPPTQPSDSAASQSDMEESEAAPPPATSKRGRARKTTSAATATRTSRRKGKAKAFESEDENATPAPTKTRQSTRTTRSRRATARTQFETPAANTGKAGLINAGLNTPLITPKFDPRLPLTPAVMREAKRGETIVSMSGSPINNPARLDTEKPGILTLGNGKVIDVGGSDEQMDNLAMDETTRKNIQMLQENLAKILQHSRQTQNF